MSENTERDELTETEIEADRNAAEARVTAPDPRLGEIEARLAAAEPGPWFLDNDGVSIYYVFHNGDTMDRDRLAESSGADAVFIANAPADVAYLLAELRGAREALGRVEVVAARAEVTEESGYTGPKGSLSDWEQGFNDGKAAVAEALRAAVAASGGGGE